MSLDERCSRVFYAGGENQACTCVVSGYQCHASLNYRNINLYKLAGHHNLLKFFSVLFIKHLKVHILVK